MDTTVCKLILKMVKMTLCFIGEMLEKATRALSEEDKALLETDFIGKNGQRRKLEV
jgi:hypothetical protein